MRTKHIRGHRPDAADPLLLRVAKQDPWRANLLDKQVVHVSKRNLGFETAVADGNFEGPERDPVKAGSWQGHGKVDKGRRPQ